MSVADTESDGYDSDGCVWETWSERSWHCGCRYDPWPGQIFSEDEEEKETSYENAKRKGAESRAHMKRKRQSGPCRKKERRRRDKIEAVRGAIDTHTAEPKEMFIAPGDFSFMTGATTRIMCDDAYKAITIAEAWDFVKGDPGDGGFMFSSSPYSAAITKAMKYDGHSGASYGWTMRVMQQIARVGWEQFVAGYVEPEF
jgi:hypothetical protein